MTSNKEIYWNFVNLLNEESHSLCSLFVSKYYNTLITDTRYTDFVPNETIILTTDKSWDQFDPVLFNFT